MAARALTVTPCLSPSLHRPRYGGVEPIFSPFQSWGPGARPCRALSQTQDGESWQEHTHLPGAWVGLVHAPEAPGVQSTAHPPDRLLHSLSWELETRVL